MIRVFFKPLHASARIPHTATPGSVGYDVFSIWDTYLREGEVTKVDLGFALQMPREVYAQIMPRSGRTCNGLIVHPGTVDSDYRGELKVMVQNIKPYAVWLQAGGKIAQLLFLPRLMGSLAVELIPAEQLNQTTRGESGFGSTGD